MTRLLAKMTYLALACVLFAAAPARAAYSYLPTLFDTWLELRNNPLIPAIAAQHVHYRGPWDVPMTRQGVSNMIESIAQTDWFIDNPEHPEDAYIVPSEFQSIVRYDPAVIPYLRFIVAMEYEPGAPLFIQWRQKTVALGNNLWQNVGREMPPFVDFPNATSFDAYDSQFDYEINIARDDAVSTFTRDVFNAPVFGGYATFIDCTFNTQIYVGHPTFITTEGFSAPEPTTVGILAAGGVALLRRARC